MPNETAELIIQFNRGVSDEDARSVVAGIGGTVRRNMRTDHADQVMLLARVPAADVRRLAQEASGHPQVARVEVNSDGFSIR